MTQLTAFEAGAGFRRYTWWPFHREFASNPVAHEEPLVILGDSGFPALELYETITKPDEGGQISGRSQVRWVDILKFNADICPDFTKAAL